MTNATDTGKPLTGRKVLLIAIAAFGTIVAVNITLAVKAISTFPGLEVANSYVASQSFNEDVRTQTALGWHVDAGYENGMLRISFLDDADTPVVVNGLEATVGRATQARDDQTPQFTYTQGTFLAPVELALGNWNIRLVATAPDGTSFRQRVVLHVTE
jgi:nitrogen fixation protein FixH